MAAIPYSKWKRTDPHYKTLIMIMKKIKTNNHMKKKKMGKDVNRQFQKGNLSNSYGDAQPS
jgi:hypothetical protein